MVEFIQDGKAYALKYTPKDQAIRDKAIYHIVQERRLLEEVAHPFICGLKFSFQDDTIMYMILDYMGGGDLRAHMKNRKWSEVRPPPFLQSFYKNHQDETRIVIAEIASALEYLHSKNIVHRDMKPDVLSFDQ